MDNTELDESLEEDLHKAKLARDFFKSEYWLELIKPGIEGELPRTSPYKLDTLIEIKAQGGRIEGLTFIESYLLSLIDKGENSEEMQKQINNETL